MKRGIFLCGLFTLLVMVGPASADIVLDFGDGGAASPTGNCTVTSTTTKCTNVGIGVLKVSGTPSADGNYLVDGGTPGVVGGLLSFDTSNNTITITGSLDCTTAAQSGVASSASICSAAQDTAHFELVPSNTVLLQGTGTFGALSISGAGNSLAAVSFTDLDSKGQLLLAALGLPTTGCVAGLCPGWDLTAFNISIRQGSSGNTYTSISTDIANSPTPEPTSIVLFGSVLVGVTQLVRRRSKKA